MRLLLTVFLGAALLAGACYADGEGKESYSLGYQFGQYLQSQGLEIDLEVYLSGIEDALAGKEPLLSREEIRTTIKALQQRLEAAREMESRQKAAKTLEECTSGADRLLNHPMFPSQLKKHVAARIFWYGGGMPLLQR